eukprot:1295739-Amphidinium_carterae.1
MSSTRSIGQSVPQPRSHSCHVSQRHSVSMMSGALPFMLDFSNFDFTPPLQFSSRLEAVEHRKQGKAVLVRATGGCYCPCARPRYR